MSNVSEEAEECGDPGEEGASVDTKWPISNSEALKNLDGKLDHLAPGRASYIKNLLNLHKSLFRHPWSYKFVVA